MTLDFRWPVAGKSAESSALIIPRAGRNLNSHESSYGTRIKWRQSILSITYECLDLLDSTQPGSFASIWRQEARQRALNFLQLGFSEILPQYDLPARAVRGRWDIARTATLGGAYRLLMRCDGTELVECRNLLHSFLTSLALAYSPVYGKIRLRLDICSIVLPRIKCRALILALGALTQGIIRHSCSGPAKHLNMELSVKRVSENTLTLKLTSCPVKLLGSPEFDLACRLYGLLQAELCCVAEHDDRLRMIVSFDVPDSNQKERIGSNP